MLPGDPYWAFHPVRLFGRLIAWDKRWFDHPSHQRAKGMLLAFILMLGVWGFFFAIKQSLTDYRYILLVW